MFSRQTCWKNRVNWKPLLTKSSIGSFLFAGEHCPLWSWGSKLKLKKLNWVERAGIHQMVVMGIIFAAFEDKDGTFTVSMSGIPNRRPEMQKEFATLDKAKEYAVSTMLAREIKRYFA